MTVSLEEKPSLGYTFFLKQNYLGNYNSNPVKLLIEDVWEISSNP